MCAAFKLTNVYANFAHSTIKISGIDGIALTKLDVLDELDEIKMCVKYDLNGNEINYLPAAVEDQLRIKPIYKTFPGWKTSFSLIKGVVLWVKKSATDLENTLWYSLG